MSNIDEQFEGALKAEALSQHPQLPEPEPLSPDAPAPRLKELVAQYGEEPTARALAAWEQRLNGESIIEVAHNLGLSIETAKVLLREVHNAVAEDLKANLEMNRSLDLARIDALINAHYPRAKQGKIRSAQLILRCLERRSRLVGLEALPDPGRSQPQNILIWLQAQLPSINRIVDSLPPEVPPAH